MNLSAAGAGSGGLFCRVRIFFAWGHALQNFTVRNKLGGLGKMGNAKGRFMTINTHIGGLIASRLYLAR
jgi:hypothetical protein